jgi:hypothetical protein
MQSDVHSVPSYSAVAKAAVLMPGLEDCRVREIQYAGSAF